MLFEVQLLLLLSLVNGYLTPEYEAIQNQTREYLQFDNWAFTQIYIYYRFESIEKGKAPDCLGTLLNDEYVLTKGTCIILNGFEGRYTHFAILVTTAFWQEF